MKNLPRFFTLSLLLFAMVLKTSAQVADDRIAVLKKCLELKEMKDILPHASDGTIAQLHVLQHGVSFPENAVVTVYNRKVSFITKSMLSESSAIPYFLFWELSVKDGAARADFVYNTNSQPSFHAVVDLKKNGDNWDVVNVSTERR